MELAGSPQCGAEPCWVWSRALLGVESPGHTEQPLLGVTPSQQWGCTVGLSLLVHPWSSREDWRAAGLRETPLIHQKALTLMLPQPCGLHLSISGLSVWEIEVK